MSESEKYLILDKYIFSSLLLIWEMQKFLDWYIYVYVIYYTQCYIQLFSTDLNIIDCYQPYPTLWI